MSSISPFSFREFGDGGSEILAAGQPKAFLPQSRSKEAAAPAPPPPPVFSEEQVKSAERDGYQRGFLDGVTEGKNIAHSKQAEVDAELTQNVAQFVTQLSPLFATYREMLKAAGQQVPELAQAIAKKVAGCALEEKAYSVIEEVALRCLETMYHEPKLVITVHESLSATLEAKIAAESGKLQAAGEISVVGDANIASANCRIEWKGGAMVRDTAALWQHVEQVIASMVASNERDADAVADSLENHITQPNQPTEGE